jgi:putative phage-type endonuclease
MKFQYSRFKAIFFVQNDNKGVITMKRILDKRGMTEEDWQIYREQQKGIGGSEISSVLGINRFKSKFELWLEKTGQVKKPFLTSEAVEWGNLLEPVVRDKFRAVTGFKVFKNNFVLQHDIHDFMIANVDGEVIDPSFGGRGILEIKTTGSHNAKDWVNGCPDYYMAQVQWYLGCTGYEYAYIAVLIGGQNFKYFLIERDDYIIDIMIKEAMVFMDMVRNHIPPEIGGSQTESEWLLSAFPEAIEEEISIPYELERMAQEYVEIQEEIKEKTKKAEELKNKIRLEAKDVKVLKGELIKISMPTIKKVLFDSKKFQEEHPDLYAQYKTKESSYRGFTISNLGEKL